VLAGAVCSPAEASTVTGEANLLLPDAKVVVAPPEGRATMRFPGVPAKVREPGVDSVVHRWTGNEVTLRFWVVDAEGDALDSRAAAERALRERVGSLTRVSRGVFLQAGRIGVSVLYYPTDAPTPVRELRALAVDGKVYLYEFEAPAGDDPEWIRLRDEFMHSLVLKEVKR
jgi:hypothetical protein